MEISKVAEKLSECQRNAVNAREQLIKTRKKLNECVISSKRAEAAKEEIEVSSGGQTFKQVGRVFVNVSRDGLLSELNNDLEQQGSFRTQLKELDDRMFQRAEECNDALKKSEIEFTETLKKVAQNTTKKD